MLSESSLFLGRRALLAASAQDGVAPFVFESMPLELGPAAQLPERGRMASHELLGIRERHRCVEVPARLRMAGAVDQPAPDHGGHIDLDQGGSWRRLSKLVRVEGPCRRRATRKKPPSTHGWLWRQPALELGRAPLEGATVHQVARGQVLGRAL
ncbi:MAG TPA: hypothetical protein VL086_09135 [Candidatus Nitrosotalea sp.]|nr:hypothetical protein [Candidatus Nitrosotalea sp.]